jgi:Golgi nucleoside diphosphatase
LKFLNDSWAKVITGSEEGVFGWITGNYLNRILFDNEEKGKVTTLPYGSIDLGGYSLEITFYTEEEIKEHRVNLSLSNINYNLYSYSFQDYGQDKFNEHLLHFLIENSTESEDSTVIQHPCYLNGFITTYIYKDINYTIQGNNNIDKCKESIALLMNINKKEEGEKSMNDTYQPKIPDGTKFYGISGLYWIAYFFDLADDKFHAPSEFLPVTEQFCKKNWDDAVKEYSQKTDKNRLKNYCITGFYVYYFLAQGFKLEENKQIISFPDKISNVEVSWTLGAMSYEVGLQPLKYARFYIDE